MVTFADWLEPWLACAVGSSVFHVAGNLSGQLAEVDAGQGVLDSVHGGHPGRIAEVEWWCSLGCPRHSVQGVPW